MHAQTEKCCAKETDCRSRYTRIEKIALVTLGETQSNAALLTFADLYVELLPANFPVGYDLAAAVVLALHAWRNGGRENSADP